MFFSRWIRRLRDVHPDHRAIAGSMAWVALFVLLSSVARAIRDVAIAYRYGVGTEVDAYLFVFNLVSWPIAVWFSVVTAVLVPLASRLRRVAPAELPCFRSELLGLSILIGLAFTLLGWLGLPLLLGASWTGLPDATAATAISIAPSLILLAPLGVIISLFSAWMLAAARHVNTLLESVPALVLLITLLIFPDGGIQPLVWGTVVGFVLHLATLAMPLARQGEIGPPRFTRRSSPWVSFWHGLGIMLAGQVLMSLTSIIDQFFAAHLGTGAIAALSYANKVLLLILGMGAVAVSRATLPVFSKAQAQGEEHVHRVAIHWVKLMFSLGGGAALMGWLFAPQGVALLFERGAFSARDTAVVTDIFRYGLPQLPFFFAGLVLVNYLTSRRLYIWLFWSGVIGLSAKLLGNALLIPMYGTSGIMLATALMYATNFAFFWWIFQRMERS